VEASVLFDEERNAATVVDYLAGLGHREIAHVSGSLRTDTGLRRHRGFEEAIARHDLPMRPQWRADGDFTIDGGREATLKVMDLPVDRRPTAIAVDSLVEAIGTLSALRELGLTVPDDVSVMAIDEHLMAAQLTPPMTTLRLPQRELGKRAADMLFDVIAGKPGARVIVEDPVEIVERQSTAPPRAR
jgi:DNA-binding LacI/PurR family transcriptional regulator